MLKKLMLLGCVALMSGSLGACSNRDSTATHSGASQSLQKARVAKHLRPELCNYADILGDHYRLDYSHTIAELAVMMNEDPNLNPRTRSVGGDCVGLFQTPESALKQYARKYHQKYNSANVQIDYISGYHNSNPRLAKDFRNFKHDDYGSPKKLAHIFAKKVMRAGTVDQRHLNQNVDKLEDK